MIQIPDLTGVPADIYNFFITVIYDGDSTNNALYIFKVDVVHPCVLSQINIDVISDINLIIDASANSY